MAAESIITVRVRPAKFTKRVAALISERLEGRLKARVEPKGDRVLVRTAVESETGAAAATDIMKDVAQGVRQTLALDALDEELRQVSISVE